MYNWNDILILGDSFCGERIEPTHWPMIVARKLTNDTTTNLIPRGKGFPGASWWSTRKYLIESLENTPAKVVIVCHTDMMRIPSDRDLSLNFRSVEVKELSNSTGNFAMPDELHKAATLYFTHLCSYKFQEWSQKQWFYELDWTLNKHNIEKVIHIHCFPDFYGKPVHKFKYGVTVEDPLYNYHNITTPDAIFPNHLTIEHNAILADTLCNLISNYPGHGKIYSKKLFEDF